MRLMFVEIILICFAAKFLYGDDCDLFIACMSLTCKKNCYDTKLAPLLSRSNWLKVLSAQLKESVDITILFLTDNGTGEKENVHADQKKSEEITDLERERKREKERGLKREKEREKERKREIKEREKVIEREREREKEREHE